MKMPALFIGHGSPMNIIQKNTHTEHLKNLGKEIPLPKAILVISAHWLTNGIFVSTADKPKTIYDFYGFPEELYNISYPCKGSPETAVKISTSIKEIAVDNTYGLDHASWAVLKHMYPNADAPVFEMSIDINKPFQYHFDLGKKLDFLRDEGILIIGSGNLVHNLRIVSFEDNAKPMDWAIEADEIFKKLLLSKDFSNLIDPFSLAGSVKLAIPTPDHYIPMLYILGMMQEKEQIKFTHESIQNGSVSMRCFSIS